MALAFRNAHALVIGVGGDLPVTVEDAKAVARILTDPDRCAIPANNVRVLTDMEATRSGIIDALQEVAHRAKPDDAVTIYFSGHGGMLPTSPERRFLIPRDGDLLYSKQFTDLLRKIPAHRLLVLLDCCYAGGLYMGPAAKDGGVKPVPVPFDLNELQLREGTGTVVLSSSRDNEVSLTGNPYSFFTQVIIDALCGAGSARQDGYVYVGDLAMHLAQWVPRFTNDTQHPKLDLEAADNYPVAYYAAGGKARLDRPDWFQGALTAPVREPPATTPTAPPERTVLSLSSALEQLRDILAEWIPQEEEARQVVRNSGVRAGIAWKSYDSISFWQTVLDHAHRSWSMEDLFAAADEVFGNNPDWWEAKQDYLAAREADRRQRIHSVGDTEADTVDLNERRLRALSDALGKVVPSIFRDPRISDRRLKAATTALSPVGPIMAALNAAATAETRQPRRQELQQLDYSLRTQYTMVSQKLSALKQVRSEELARQPCGELAGAAPGLLMAWAQAIQKVT
jgi:Caspase domain/Effector-associated domain 1